MGYKVIIVDDHPIFRDGFKYFLKTQSTIDEVFEADSGEKFLEILQNTAIDLAFVDINMPGKDGFETTKEALVIHPDIKILGISAFETIDYIDKMLASGADGYVLKDAGHGEIKEAIEKVMNGDIYFSPKILAKLSKRAVVKKDDESDKIEILALSKREQEVLELLCKGLNRNEIAKKLFISERTVDKHKENLQIKTNTKNAVSLVLFALKHQIIKV